MCDVRQGDFRPYNYAASAYLEVCLEGAVVICDYVDGKPAPLKTEMALSIRDNIRRRNRNK